MTVLRSYLHIFLILFIAVIQQSCVNDNDPCEYATPGLVKLRFNLNLGDMGHVTRADGLWNPAYSSEAGNRFDNTIILNDSKAKWLHVMLINSDGDLLHLNLEEGFQLNPSTGGYDMTATLDFSDQELRKKWTPGIYRVMVLANFRDRDSNSNDPHIDTHSTFASLAGKLNKFNCDWYDKTPAVRNNGNIPNIPMWGMTRARFNFDGVSTQTFSVDFLRGVAKVKIQLTQKLQDAGYKIVDATVNCLNKKINCMPTGWQDAITTADNSQPFDASFNPNDGTLYSNVIFKESTNPTGENDDDGSLVFYLPEWNAKSSKNPSGVSNVIIDAKIADDLGNLETCQLTVSNASLGQGNYKNDINNVNRNHLYQFTLDKDINEGKLSYKLDCWNLQQSSIGWNPPSWEFTSSDSESEWGYVSFPSYNSAKDKDIIEETTAFADYQFTLTEPAGAVWKAFLVENDVEYPAGGNFRENEDGSIIYKNSADTPNGFFFGVGNDDKNNNRAASTGIARPEPYNIKVGTRLQTTDFHNNIPDTLTDNPDFIALNAAGQYWKDKNVVPTCYLVIKVALDGKNFSECLAINPLNTVLDKENDRHFKTYRYAGDATHIEIRQLPLFYKNKSKHDNARHIIGINNDDKHSDFRDNTWWSYPMGHKDIPVESPEPSEREDTP